jgi:hypothetical protein
MLPITGLILLIFSWQGDFEHNSGLSTSMYEVVFLSVLVFGGLLFIGLTRI